MSISESTRAVRRCQQGRGIESEFDEPFASHVAELATFIAQPGDDLFPFFGLGRTDRIDEQTSGADGVSGLRQKLRQAGA